MQSSRSRSRTPDAVIAGDSPLSAGEITNVIRDEFGISQPAVSQHLKVLRESGFASCSVDGQRRLYAIEDAPLQEVDMWLDRYRRFWTRRLDALTTKIRRGKRAAAEPPAPPPRNDTGEPT